MKSFAIAALAGAASAAWAPPAYGGDSSAPVASSSAPPAEEYSQPPAGYSQPPAGYDTTTASATTPAAGYPSKPASGYGSSASASMTTYACNPAHAYPNGAQCVSTNGYLTLVTPTASVPGAYGTGSSSAPAYSPKPTGGYGGSWGSGNGTEGGYGGHGGDSYVTQVVTSFETYCPYATTLTYNSKTYTVSSATTLTVTDCPCAISTPAVSYKPSVTTEVLTSFTTTCPGKTTVTYGPSTYTVSSSTVLTVTDCPGGCTVTNEVPATWVVPTYTTYCPKPSVPTTITIGTETYPISDSTVITVTAPTSYQTYTSVFTSPAQPTSYVVGSTTYPVSEATTVTYSVPTQQGYTVTAPYSSIWSAPPAPAGSTPAGPVPGYPAPSGYAPAGNGSSPVSPNMPVQTGNGAEKLVAGGAAFAAVIGALFL